MKTFNPVRLVVGAIAVLMAVAVAVPIATAQEDKPAQILITNVNVWDGTSDVLANGQSVLVEGNLIKQVGPSISAPGDATVIDGGGRTLIPGLIDVHTHLSLHGDLFQIRNEQNWRFLRADERGIRHADPRIQGAFEVFHAPGNLEAGNVCECSNCGDVGPHDESVQGRAVGRHHGRRIR